MKKKTAVKEAAEIIQPDPKSDSKADTKTETASKWFFQLSSQLKKNKIATPSVSTPASNSQTALESTTAFTQALAHEIVKNLTNLGQFTTRSFRRGDTAATDVKSKPPVLGEFPVLVDSSILIDGRIVPIVNSGFFTGNLIIPQFVLNEVQYIADSSDIVRRTKGRRGLDVVQKLKAQKINPKVTVKIIKDDPVETKEVDHKLLVLIKKWKAAPGGRELRLLTVDYNLAQLGRAENIKVLNVNDLAQAIKIALVPGEEMAIKITHEGREREQGVGYLGDGTMVVVDAARDKVGSDLNIVITKIHQTPAGQLFFGRIK